MKPVILLCFILVFAWVEAADPELEEEELRARAFLQHLNNERLKNDNREAIAGWNYDTNITEHNKREKLTVGTEVAAERKKQWQEVTKFNWRMFKDNDLKRQFKLLSVLGTSILPVDRYKKYFKTIADMEQIYSTATICALDDPEKCDLSLEPDLTETLINSQDEKLLKHVWVEWRNAVGPKVKHMYKEYVELQNEAAHLNNFTDAGEYWLSDYDTNNMKEQVEAIWNQLKPFYVQLHAYVRNKLRQKYGDVVSEKGPIPAHLLGNMWAQNWKVYEDTKPFPEKKVVSVTDEMVKQAYDPMKIYKTAEDFFTSLNLTAMPELFWKHSVFEKPEDREFICHAAAYDFYDGLNFRIRQCTTVSEEHLIVAHHEMGHVEYFLQYKNQPSIYRDGANDGFHEAIGDVIALSVNTLKHLRQIGLTQEQDDIETEINNLYNIGLHKIAFLPFAYIMDVWRWDVFSGKTCAGEYNCKWWKLAEEHQGIEPPVDRTEKDFDPGSKYHIVANVPYLRYFISYIIQFQFHRALCIKAGQYDPRDPTKHLHQCDIYGNTDAGSALGKMLQMGKSRPWQDAMEVITGQRNMDASGILEYFRPLREWLEAYNYKNGVYIGWEPSTKLCVKSKKELTDHQQIPTVQQ